MILWLISLSVLLGVAFGHRALSLDAENYVTDLFKSINPRIAYDKTNYLVDLSGQYVVCENLRRQGELAVSELSKDGRPIYGLIDYGVGPEEDVRTVTMHVKRTFKSWESDPRFRNVILKADTFGCSNRPSCSGHYVVGCLFTTRKPFIPRPIIPRPPIPPMDAPGPKALAFTPQQYYLTEGITGVNWDRSYYLENLSGTETDCSMVDERYHDWVKSEEIAFNNMGLRVTGISGSAVNMGDTESAMRKIINDVRAKMKYSAKKLGCSVIPDCPYRGKLHVVVGCLFET